MRHRLQNWLMRGTVAVFCAMLIAGCAGGATPQAAAQTSAPPAAAPAPAQAEVSPDDQTALKEFLNAYRMGTGDKLRVIVFDEEQLSGEFIVSDSGTVSLPLIGTVQASDLTIGQFEQRITEKLMQGYVKQPRVSVQILNYRPFYIYGQVTNPGEYPYTIGLRVVKAVARAGGYTYRANTRKVYVTRAKDGRREEVDARASTLIFPGDVIEVPERYF